MLARDLSQAIEIGWMPAHVHRDDRLRSRSDCGFHLIEIDAVRIWKNIDHDWQRSREQNGAGRRDESEIRNNDLVAGADVESAIVTSSAAVPLVNAMPCLAP